MSKPAELRDQTDEQLELLLKETQQNLFRLRLQSETERLEAPSEIIKAKREIARIKTILRLREIERRTGRRRRRLTRNRVEVRDADGLNRPGTAMSQPSSSPATAAAPARRRRKTEIGVVTSDKMNKTRRVEVETLVPHPKYGKMLRRRTVCHAHDETNAVARRRHRRDHGDPPAVEAQAVADRPDRPPGRAAGPGRRGRGGQGLSVRR